MDPWVTDSRVPTVNETVISHYRLLHPLGEGGMGVVFRAEDLRLGREVAIKFLRAEEAKQAEWLARFEREAKLASALQHPHICTVHELGEHEGRPFIVMELLEGRTIRQLIEDGPLPIGALLEFAVQIASALDAAHGRGIVHRDIKPANLFVTHGDRLKVLDFGLAKLAAPQHAPPVLASDPTLPYRPDVTMTGVTVGTAAYMSPEQATGAPVDARSDLFSFGSVLYEMATGRRAFPGDSTPIVLMRLRNGDVVPVRAINPAIPDRLERIIQRAMDLDPSRRYQSAGEMLADLQALARRLSPDASATGIIRPAAAEANRAAPSGRRRWAIAGGIAIVALVATLWLLVPARPGALTDRDSILIGTFSNTTTDPVFDETLLTALKVQLGQSPFLDIIGDDRITEALRSMGRPADSPLTSDVAREICQRLGAKAMLEGSVNPLGTSYVLTLNAIDCATGASVARDQEQSASKEQVLRIVGSMSSSMRTKLGESLPSIRRFDVPIEQATTPSLAALKAYALGLAERRKGRELESVAFFNQAIELDPEFAAAYTTLSAVYGSVGEWRRSEEHARLAYSKLARVSERERLFITYQYHDRVTGDQDRAAETLELWKLAYPRDSRPVNALALIHNRFGRYEQAAAEANEALRRTPGHPFPLSNLATAYRGLGRYGDARKVAEEAVALGVATMPTRRLLYQLDVMDGSEAAAQHLEWARDRPREFDLLSAQAQVAAFEGRLQAAAVLYGHAADKALARGLRGTASGYWAHLAWTEALYSDRRTARKRVRELAARTAPDADGPGTVPRFRAAVALALAGHPAEAGDIAARARQTYPDSTLVRTVLVPSTEAALALYRGRPADAVAMLEAALPSEFGTVAGLVPIYLRAEAFVALGEASRARREYQKVLDHRGSDPFAPVVPLAHLGLARAWALERDLPKSRAAYEALFRLWQDADPDLWILRVARGEYADLPSGRVAVSSAARPR